MSGAADLPKLNFSGLTRPSVDFRPPHFYNDWYLKNKRREFPTPRLRGGPNQPLDSRYGGSVSHRDIHWSPKRLATALELYTHRRGDFSDVETVFSHAPDVDDTDGQLVADAKEKYRDLVHELRTERRRRLTAGHEVKVLQAQLASPERARADNSKRSVPMSMFERIQCGKMIPPDLSARYPRVLSQDTRQSQVRRPAGRWEAA